MNESILLVDDSEEFRRSVRAFLVRSGFFVSEAANGVEALEMLKDLQPHLVITDLVMPKMGGLEFLRRAQQDMDRTPFLIISGEGTMDDVIEGLRLGAWDYLIKPISPLDLLKHSIDRALERTRLLSSAREHQTYLESTITERTAELQQKNLAYEAELKERRAMAEMAWQVRNEWVRTIDAIPDMIAIVDIERRVVRLNRAMQERIGKPLEEIIGHACPLCVGGKVCPHARVVREEKAEYREFFSEEFACDFSLHVIPFQSTSGEVVGTVHIFKDITEQKKTIREKEILHTQLLSAHKLESVGQLAAGIAHEINTPLQFVSSNVGFLDEAFGYIASLIATLKDSMATNGSISSDALQDALDTADWPYLQEEFPLAIAQSRDGLDRVTAIVRAMKEFSHPGSKDFSLVNINHLIEVTVTLARNEWKYVAEVVLKLSPDLPEIPCMAGEIGQTLLNLLVNAAHAITEKIGKDPKNGKGTITIETHMSDQVLTIMITDTGSGIPEAIQSRIFDPFFTTKDVGKGTGQGLAIAYDVVTNKHKGKLTCSSKVGTETTFVIELPINTDSSTNRQQGYVNA